MTENITIYFCEICEHNFGVFYSWDQVDEEISAITCPVCNTKTENVHFSGDYKVSLSPHDD